MASDVPSSVLEGFHFETKYVILSYLGLLPPRRSGSATLEGDEQVAQAQDRERHRTIKGQVEEELRLLEEEVCAAFSRTGFDCHTSAVFSPPNPESSVEDCLALLGDREAPGLHTHLCAALQSLLSAPLDYERYRDAVQEVSSHSQGGWTKVLVPLMLLQALQGEGQPLTTLVPLGVRFLEELESDFILQQGGWGALLKLEEVEPGVIVAEDSNDIYILSGDLMADRPSPPSSLLATDEGGDPSSWKTDSQPVSLAGTESWSHVGALDPEDAKSLDSDVGAALAEERSENNSSNSDIVHVEREEAELMEVGGAEAGSAALEAELQESVLSVLGTESELVEMRTETPPPKDVSVARKTSSEGPVVMQASPSHQVSEPAAVEEPSPRREPSPVPEQTSALTASPMQAEVQVEPRPLGAPPLAVPMERVQESHAGEPSELSMLLYGGAALAAVAAVVAYGAMAYRRK